MGGGPDRAMNQPDNPRHTDVPASAPPSCLRALVRPTLSSIMNAAEVIEQIQQLSPQEQGKVVDFVHVDVWRGTLQDLIPFLGGGDVYFALFPIWNVADMAIVGGVVGILLFQQRFHDQRLAEAREAAEVTEVADVTSDADSQQMAPAVSARNGQASVTTDTAPQATRPATD